MLPFSSKRSSTLPMSKLPWCDSRTPSATFSKSQNTAMLLVSVAMAAIIADRSERCFARDQPAAVDVAELELLLGRVAVRVGLVRLREARGGLVGAARRDLRRADRHLDALGAADALAALLDPFGALAFLRLEVRRVGVEIGVDVALAPGGGPGVDGGGHGLGLVGGGLRLRLGRLAFRRCRGLALALGFRLLVRAGYEQRERADEGNPGMLVHERLP